MAITLFALLTWTTRDREPLITAAGAGFLREFLPKAARRHRAQVLGLGIVQDHIHLLLYLDSLVDIPTLVQRRKGASARIANREQVLGATRLRWARGYDLRSVSPRALPAARAYLARQDARHPGLAVAQPDAEARAPTGTGSDGAPEQGDGTYASVERRISSPG